MTQKVKLDDNEYELSELSESVRAQLASVQFIDEKIKELTNMQALLQRAKIGYMEYLKKEMLSKKAGFLFGDD